LVYSYGVPGDPGNFGRGSDHFSICVWLVVVVGTGVPHLRLKLRTCDGRRSDKRIAGAGMKLEQGSVDA